MTLVDTLLSSAGRALASLSGAVEAQRENPAGSAQSELDARGRSHAAGLMRVNHCGEICAQALYEGQAATARDDALKAHLLAAAEEEADHLAWCRDRLAELEDRPSVLAPVFFGASYLLGVAAGLLGERVSLGFVAATEEQVERHLDSHIERLPQGDRRSRAILEAMRDDEARHGADALRAGGADFPRPVKSAMALVSKAMTLTTYRL